jgi:integrase
MAKVPSVTIHDLRHTTASIAISMGASVMGVRTMLGHSSTKMTLDTYTHLFPEDLRLVSNSINEAIARGSK